MEPTSVSGHVRLAAALASVPAMPNAIASARAARSKNQRTRASKLPGGSKSPRRPDGTTGAPAPGAWATTTLLIPQPPLTAFRACRQLGAGVRGSVRGQYRGAVGNAQGDDLTPASPPLSHRRGAVDQPYGEDEECSQ